MKSLYPHVESLSWLWFTCQHRLKIVICSKSGDPRARCILCGHMELLASLILLVAALFPAVLDAAPPARDGVEDAPRECVPVDGGELCRPVCPQDGCPEPGKVVTDS